MNHLVYLHTVSAHSKKANLIQVLEMCSSFAALADRVTLLLPSDGRSDEEVTAAAHQKLGVQQFPFTIAQYVLPGFLGRARQYLAAFFLIPSVLKWKDDVFFIRNPIVYAVLGFLPIRIVFESHNAMGGNALYRFLRRLVIRHARSRWTLLFISISGNLDRYWAEQGIDSRKRKALHDAVNLEKFTPRKSRREYREQLQLPMDRRIFTYAGSLYKNRNIDMIVDAAHRFTDCLFVVIGGEQHEIDALKQSTRSDNIIFTGYLSQGTLREYLWASDYLLMLWSSSVDTINYCSPLKVFEYMASRSVIIGHGFITIQEVLTDQVEAFLVEPDSIEKLTETIGAVLERPYPQEMADKAYASVKEHYTWDQRARAIMEGIHTSEQGAG